MSIIQEFTSTKSVGYEKSILFFSLKKSPPSHLFLKYGNRNISYIIPNMFLFKKTENSQHSSQSENGNKWNNSYIFVSRKGFETLKYILDLPALSLNKFVTILDNILFLSWIISNNNVFGVETIIFKQVNNFFGGV